MLRRDVDHMLGRVEFGGYTEWHGEYTELRRAFAVMASGHNESTYSIFEQFHISRTDRPREPLSVRWLARLVGAANGGGGLESESITDL